MTPDAEQVRARWMLLETAGTWEWDLLSDTMSWDHGHRVLFGVADAAPITPEVFLSIVHADDRARVQRVFHEAAAACRAYGVEFRIIRPADGQLRWIEARGQCVGDGHGAAAVRAVGIVLDVTERHVLQDALDQQRAVQMYHAEQFALLFEKNPEPMWVFDVASLRFLAVNDAAVQAYGWSREEFLAMTILDIRPREDVAAFLRRFDQLRRLPRSESFVRHQLRAGAIRTVHIVAHDIQWEGHAARLVLARDETERLHLEARLRDAQKMEAVGQLAGGVAHDFNNLLTVLFGALEFARDHVRVPAALGHDLDDIEAAATRARALVAQLLAFTRQQVVHMRELSLNAIVTTVAPMLSRLLGESIDVQVDLAAEELLIQADAGQLEQVLLNLALNARDAMVRTPDGVPRGTLAISTRLTEHHAGQASQWPGLVTGTCVELAIRDTGCGMSADVLERAFEPFFTTKPVGTGTGLGLSSVLGIVQQFAGAMSVESEPGVGTTFRARFPAKIEMAPRSASGSHAAVSDAAGTVLLAEDEPSVRTAVRRMLQVLGYRVIEAPDGAVALATWRAHRQEIDALVTDIRMPRMNGHDLARAIREEAPGFPVVFASGFADEGMANFTAHDRFVDKPFTSARLRDALVAVLPGG